MYFELVDNNLPILFCFLYQLDCVAIFTIHYLVHLEHGIDSSSDKVSWSSFFLLLLEGYQVIDCSILWVDCYLFELDIERIDVKVTLLRTVLSTLLLLFLVI
jgi:hypothetical protein